MSHSERAPKLPLLARGLRRRDLLAMGSVLAATPLLSRAAQAQDLLRGDALAASTISFGYIDRSGEVANLRRVSGRLRAALRGGDGFSGQEAAAVEVVPAASLPSGDPGLTNTPVRLRVQGLYPAVPAKEWPQRIDLEVFVKSPENPRGATFYAWSWRAKPENLSAPLAFLVSPDFQSEVTFVLRTLSKGQTKPTQQSSTFTLGDDAGKPRLVRGAYLLAVNGRPWDRNVTLSPDAGRASLLSLLVTAEPTPPQN